MMDGPCRCGSGLAFIDCCGPFLAGQKKPATAVALMRSRYTAYCRRDAAYLLETWQQASRPAVLDFSGDTTEWSGLAITRHEAGGPDDQQGSVEFVATYREGGKLRQLHENSRFVRESGEWLYCDGSVFPESKAARNDNLSSKAGRNDSLVSKTGRNGSLVSKTGRNGSLVSKTGRNGPCPCGSGKKFKKCCG